MKRVFPSFLSFSIASTDSSMGLYQGVGVVRTRRTKDDRKGEEERKRTRCRKRGEGGKRRDRCRRDRQRTAQIGQHMPRRNLVVVQREISLSKNDPREKREKAKTNRRFLSAHSPAWVPTWSQGRPDRAPEGQPPMGRGGKERTFFRYSGSSFNTSPITRSFAPQPYSLAVSQNVAPFADVSEKEEVSDDDDKTRKIGATRAYALSRWTCEG